MTEGPQERWIPTVATDHLGMSDPVIGALIEQMGPLSYRVDPDLWRSLIGSIVGQQLSVAAARTIRSRIAALGKGPFPTPAEVLAVSEEELRARGLSRAKASYVRDLAGRWERGEVDPVALDAKPDEDVIAELVRLRGVGRWTAEMVLIFSMGRPDVLAVDDLGLRVAAQRLYSLDDRPARDPLLTIGEPWRPYRSFASLYLWRSLEK